MGPIVCATRGGEASRRTQERAIALAEQKRSALVFIFIADPSMSNTLSGSKDDALVDELSQLGHRLLNIARQRAAERGLTADTVVRVGPLRETLEQYVRQVRASTLVIGAPQLASREQAGSPEDLPAFAKHIQAATGVEVVVVT